MKVKSTKSLYNLESKFLKALDWNVAISAETYASYLFSLRDADLPTSPQHSWSAWDSMLMGSLSSSPTRMSSGIHGSLIGVMQTHSSCFTMHSMSTAASMDDLQLVSELSREQIHVERSRPFVEDVAQAPIGMVLAVIHDRWMLDRHNPFIGAFRHAQQAAPPSHHINEPKMKKSASSPSFNAYQHELCHSVSFSA